MIERNKRFDFIATEAGEKLLDEECLPTAIVNQSTPVDLAKASYGWRRAAAIAIGLLTATLLCGFIATPAPDSLLLPLKPRNLALNLLPVVYLYISLLLVFRRPLVAAFLTLASSFAVTLGSNFKYSIVSQPVVASDFLVFSQVVENPVLFGAYVREQIPAFIAAAVALSALAWVIRSEKSAIRSWTVSIAAVLVGCVLLWQMPGILLKPEAPLHRLYSMTMTPFNYSFPADDVRKYGLFATLVRSAGDTFEDIPPADGLVLDAISTLVGEPVPAEVPGGPLPHVIVVQNEAFFDFRIIDDSLSSAAYDRWDELVAEARSGLARVNTYGGNTLRTEFSMLTGISLDRFGAVMDYPYLTAINGPVDSVPRYFGTLGYQTVAVHPFYRDFWRRDVTYDYLGFDTFHPIDEFVDAERDGPYVSDLAVCERMKGILADATEPTFLFVVTMENHGPWSFDRQQLGSLRNAGRSDFSRDTADQYERYDYHLGNAVAMVDCVLASLKSLSRPSTLLFFGDHAPAMPKVFAELGVDDPWRDERLLQVPYLVWNSESSLPMRRDIDVSLLPNAVLKVSGLPLDDYLHQNASLRHLCERNRTGGVGLAESCDTMLRNLAWHRLEIQSESREN